MPHTNIPSVFQCPPTRTFLVVAFLLITIVSDVNSEDICQDRMTNCDDYDKDLCTAFPAWADKNCAKTCGKCGVSACSDGWTYYDGDKTCVKAFDGFDNKTTWQGSRNMCQSFGGDLVVIRDKVKSDFVLGLTSNIQIYFWIGLLNVAQKGFIFMYADASSLAYDQFGIHHPWLPGNPDNHAGNERCVCMYAKGNYPGYWNDLNCMYKLPYVCSKPYKPKIL